MSNDSDKPATSQAKVDPPKPAENTPPKPAEKTPPKPVAKPAEKTPPKPVAKPAEKTPPKPVAKPTEKTPPKPAAKTPPKPVPKKPEEKPAELPAFEKGISEKLTEKFTDKVKVAYVKADRIGINVGRENIHDVAEFVRDELNYDHVESVSGVDFPADNEIEVVYHVGSYTDPSLSRQVLELSTRAQREENPIPGKDSTKLPSLRDVFYSVEFHEREIFEMLGVYFDGHPDNRRLLLPEDWADLPPLRKDFAIKGR